MGCATSNTDDVLNATVSVNLTMEPEQAETVHFLNDSDLPTEFVGIKSRWNTIEFKIIQYYDFDDKYLISKA